MKKKKKLWLIPAILVPVLAIVIVATVLIAKNVMKNFPSKGIELVAVEERDLSDTLTLRGTMSGETVTNVTSKATAEVVELKVQVGDKVKKGDVLCILDSEEIGKKLDQANSSLDKNAALNNIENRLENSALANAKDDQTRALAEAQKSIDKAQTNYNNAVNDVNNNSSTLSSNQGKLKKLEKEVKTTGEALVKAYNSMDNLPEEKKVSSPEEIKEAPEPEDSWKKEYDAYQAAVKNYADNSEKYITKIAECKAKTKTLEDIRDAAADALDVAKSAYESTKISTDRAIQSAQNSIETKKYTTDNSQFTEAVESLEEQYEACIITAPVDGVVTAVNVAVGDIAISEKPIVTIEDGDNMKLVLTVDEKHVLKLSEGMAAIITNDYMPDTEINGSVSRVVKVKSQSDPYSSAAAGYPVEISFQNNGDFLLGMSGKAKITLTKRGTGLAVPYDLVKKDEDGKSYILLAEDNGNGTYTAYKEYFTPGEEIEYYVEVKEGNIKAGDLIPNSPLIEHGVTFPASTDYFMTMEGEKKE